MFTEKEMAELHGMTSSELAAVMRIMQYQMQAKFLIGDRTRSIAVHAMAKQIIEGRAA